MRLWALLSERSLKVLEWKEYYLEFGDLPLKMIDEEFVKEDVQTVHQDIIDTQPIMALARVSRYDAGLSMSTMYSNFRYITTLNGLSYRYGVLWELEVPESFILSLKPWDRSYERYSLDMPKDTPKKERYKYLEIVNSDLVLKSNYKNVMRHKYEDESIEVMIPYLYLPHVVCYRQFEDIPKSSAVKVTTTVLRPDAFPTWIEDIYCGGDHYARSNEFPHKAISNIEQSKVCAEFGMNGVPRYYSLKEALQCCNEKTWKILNSKIVERKIPNSRLSYVNVIDLFPDGLRLE